MKKINVNELEFGYIFHDGRHLSNHFHKTRALAFADARERRRGGSRTSGYYSFISKAIQIGNEIFISEEKIAFWD